MESILKDHLNKVLKDNEYLISDQHGFRHQRTCVTGLVEHVDFMSQCLDQETTVDTVYLDFAKAFDKISHAHLINKLGHFGIGGYVVNWISEWLRNRAQRVVLDGDSSQWMSVTSGVPQKAPRKRSPIT